ncbi:MAG: glycosyltransferase, partial [Candidatus Portnoybacteria bacterium]|nr:glycosyltransferase [Candidatus Portnoybacteria bacterium]
VIKIVGDYAWEQAVNQYNVKDSIIEFQNKKYSKKVERIRKIQNKTTKAADKIIVPSRFLKRIVANWGVDKDKIEVIYNAAPELKDIKEKKLPGYTIISAGRLEPWKGMEALVEIMPDLLKKDPEFNLIIIGRGSLREKIENKTNQLKIQDKVTIIDRLPNKELMAYFKASDIFILNSEYEGLPHIVLEAMVYDLPVIVSNVCGNPELVRDGYNGFLVEQNNKEQIREKILKLYKDKELQDKFIKNGNDTIKEFDKEEMINKTINTLK